MAFLRTASAGSRATVWDGRWVGAVPPSGTGTTSVTRLLVNLGGSGAHRTFRKNLTVNILKVA